MTIAAGALSYLLCATASLGGMVDLSASNALTNAPMAGLTVDAFRRVGNELVGVARLNTDASGSAQVDLPGVGEGVTYVFIATPFNGGMVLSDDVTQAGDFEFRLGKMPVTVVASGSGEALVDTYVSLLEVLPDGTHQWTSGGATDSAGVVVFDPPGLGTGRQFILEAVSPWDGMVKASNVIDGEGEVVFVVGTAPLFVSLVDAIDGTPIPGVSILAYERIDDVEVAVASGDTDVNGEVVFDLDGLGEGRVYFLRTTPFNGGPVDSADLNAAGEMVFWVGFVRAVLEDARTSQPLVGTEVMAFEVLADGTHAFWRIGDTDAAGTIRFDLPGVSESRPYVLSALSPVDGSLKYSQPITAPGDVQFALGEGPLEVTVLDRWTSVPCEDLQVLVGEKVAGDVVWIAAQTTDAAGRLVLDLDGLGTGRTFVLSADPNGTGRTYSADVTSPGTLAWQVGSLEVTMVDGATGQTLAGMLVYAAERLADGSFNFFGVGATDEFGIARFDPPGLSQTVVLFAQSPTDGTYKLSADIVGAQRYQFRIGNTPLGLTVKDGISGAPLQGRMIHMLERVGGGFQYVATQQSDASGRVAFDLDGLDQGRTYVAGTDGYNDLFVLSRDYTEPGEYDFPIGIVEVRLTGAGDVPLVNQPVILQEQGESGDYSNTAWGYTDEAGRIRFDPRSLGSGVSHRVWAISPVGGTMKYSQPFSSAGIVDLVVGANPLVVTTVDGVTGAAIPSVWVAVKELTASGDQFARYSATSSEGRVEFDLDGLGEGRSYVLETYAESGVVVRTEAITEPGEVFLRLGTVAVRVIDADQGTSISNVAVTAIEKTPGGGYAWRAQVVTDSEGVARFDLVGLSDFLSLGSHNDGPPPSSIYQFQVQDPFGDAEDFFSDARVVEGLFEFPISRGLSSPLDMMAPVVEILAPGDGDQVAQAGLRVRGSADDNLELAQISVVVRDAAGIVRESSDAIYDEHTGLWDVLFSSGGLSAGETYTVEATASDPALNQSSDSVAVYVVSDTAAPQVAITSHTNGDIVAANGFVVSGDATDDVGIDLLVATVRDSTGGAHSLDLGVASANRWQVVVPERWLSEGDSIEVEVSASDTSGHTTTDLVSVTVGPQQFGIRHLVDRLTFGATPELLPHAEELGFQAFLDEQLDPLSINDDALDARLGGYPQTAAEIQAELVLRAIYSERQLLERMTQFWDNHFNTDLRVHGDVALEVEENALFRANALGNFRTLLEISAKSPAMLYYLDQENSVAGNPNENYARELMELHTVSVTGPYTQGDVEELSRIFTGWTVRDGAFHFDAELHDAGAKIFLGTEFPAGGGVEEGEQVLDMLVAHPATATFICEKLAMLLVTDTPSAELIGDCAVEFLALADDPQQIAEIVRLLVGSAEFGAEEQFRSKVKDPLEYVVALARNFSLETDAEVLLEATAAMGMELFQYLEPTGFAEDGKAWLSSHQLLMRARYGNAVLRGFAAGTPVDLSAYFADQGQITAPGVVDTLFRTMFHDEFTALEMQSALDVLTRYGVAPFHPDAPYAEGRLREMVATVLGFPEYQFH